VLSAITWFFKNSIYFSNRTTRYNTYKRNVWCRYCMGLGKCVRL